VRTDDTTSPSRRLVRSARPLDEFRRLGQGMDQPEGKRCQPDAGQDTSDPRRASDSDHSVTKTTRSSEPSPSIRENSHGEELRQREGGEDREFLTQVDTSRIAIRHMTTLRFRPSRALPRKVCRGGASLDRPSDLIKNQEFFHAHSYSSASVKGFKSPALSWPHAFLKPSA